MHPLCGHGELVALIERLAQNPASAYGFFGPEHIGKRRLADLFARLLADHPEPLPLEGHPDIAVLDAATEGDIESVRTFLERMHRTSARGGRRVFLIDHAEGLNLAGFNALLKDVEEPHSSTTFLFVSSQPEALPATLRSRLVPLTVREVPAGELRRWSETALGDANLNVDEAFGRPGLLVRQKEDPEWWKAVSQYASRIATAYTQPQPGVLVAALDDWQKAADGQEHPEQEWRLLLLCMARNARAESTDRINEGLLGEAILSAWRSIGGPIPTRLAFEWRRLKSEVDLTEYPEAVKFF